MSVFFHLAVLAALAAAQFSPAVAKDADNHALTARIYQVRQILENPPAAPKPKVKMPGGTGLNKPPENLLTPGTFSRQTAPDITNNDEQSLSQTPQSIFSPAGTPAFNQQAGFLGSRTDTRTIIYLVDCSGSMQGLFGWVQQQLKISIEQLRQNQYFSIIFFGNDGIFELDRDSLLRAGDKNKSQALNFIDSMKPAGRADALEALKKAIKIQTSQSDNGNAVIYFLTDGFELAENSEVLDKQITDLLNRLGPSTQINTIGFWPLEQDRVALEQIAQRSGGTFLLICDDYQPQNDKQNETRY